jgi:hypothetical protein
MENEVFDQLTRPFTRAHHVLAGGATYKEGQVDTHWFRILSSQPEKMYCQRNETNQYDSISPDKQYLAIPLDSLFAKKMILISHPDMKKDENIV